LWSLLCLALLGGLVPAEGTSWLLVGLSALTGLLAGWVLLLLLGWGLALIGGKVSRAGVKTAVSRGFLLLVPFTVLALAAEWGLGWQAAGAFTAAGIMTGSTAVGVELAQAGGGKLRSLLLPVLGGAAVTSGWMIAINLALAFLGRALA